MTWQFKECSNNFCPYLRQIFKCKQQSNRTKSLSYSCHAQHSSHFCHTSRPIQKTPIWSSVKLWEIHLLSFLTFKYLCKTFGTWLITMSKAARICCLFYHLSLDEQQRECSLVVAVEEHSSREQSVNLFWTRLNSLNQFVSLSEQCSWSRQKESQIIERKFSLVESISTHVCCAFLNFS